MHPFHLLAARSHVFGLGAPESIGVLILLLVLSSGYALPQPARVRTQPGRFTRNEIYFVASLGVVLAAAIAAIVREAVGQ